MELSREPLARGSIGSGPGRGNGKEPVWAGRTISQLSQELGVASEDLRKWIMMVERAEAIAAGAGTRLVPESRVAELEQEIEELKHLLRRQAVKIQILERKGIL
jgi:transposase-like protein